MVDFLVDFLAVFFAAFLAGDFLATVFFAAVFFVVAFLAAVFLAGAFFAGVFLVAAFLVTAFLVTAFLVAGFLLAGFLSSDFLAAGLAVAFFLAELDLDFLELGSSATVPGKSMTGVARSFSDNICKAKWVSKPWAAVTKRDMVWDAESMVASASTTPDFTNKRKVRSSTGTAWEPAAINAVRAATKGVIPSKESRYSRNSFFGPPAGPERSVLCSRWNTPRSVARNRSARSSARGQPPPKYSK